MGPLWCPYGSPIVSTVGVNPRISDRALSENAIKRVQYLRGIATRFGDDSAPEVRMWPLWRGAERST